MSNTDSGLPLSFVPPLEEKKKEELLAEAKQAMEALNKLPKEVRMAICTLFLFKDKSEKVVKPGCVHNGGDSIHSTVRYIGRKSIYYHRCNCCGETFEYESPGELIVDDFSK